MRRDDRDRRVFARIIDECLPDLLADLLVEIARRLIRQKELWLSN